MLVSSPVHNFYSHLYSMAQLEVDPHDSLLTLTFGCQFFINCAVAQKIPGVAKLIGPINYLFQWSRLDVNWKGIRFQVGVYLFLISNNFFG